jgi:putative FmdB family regulatory protein
MPTYEYLCQTCSHRFETWQKMTDEPLSTCPECGEKIRRVLYANGVIFKGSGFYSTDYRNGSTTPPANETKSSSNETKTGESKTGENANGSTPAPAGESKPVGTTASPK